MVGASVGLAAGILKHSGFCNPHDIHGFACIQSEVGVDIAAVRIEVAYLHVATLCVRGSGVVVLLLVLVLVFWGSLFSCGGGWGLCGLCSPAGCLGYSAPGFSPPVSLLQLCLP